MVINGINTDKITETITRDLPFGVWCADLKTKTITGFNKFSELLNIPSDTIQFSDVAQFIREDYRSVVMLNAQDLTTGADFDMTVPTNQRWLRIKMTYYDVRDNKAYGYIVESVSTDEKTSSKQNNTILTLFNKQNNMIRRTFDYMQECTYEEATTKILKNIVTTLTADRISVIMYDYKKKTQSCQYEVADYGIESRIDIVKDLSLEITPWINAEIKKRESLYIYDINSLSIDQRSQLNILCCDDVQTIIMMPLCYGSETFGFVIIDFFKENREINSTELEWIRSFGRFVEFSAHMASRERRRETDRNIRQSLVKSMPFGYLHLRYAYSVDGRPNDIAIIDANDNILKTLKTKDLVGKTIKGFFGREGDHIFSICNEVAKTSESKVVDDFLFYDGKNLSADIMMPNYNEFICLTSENNTSFYPTANPKKVGGAETVDRSNNTLIELQRTLRTHLNAIIGFAELMSIDNDNGNREKYMSIIRENAQSMLNSSPMKEAKSNEVVSKPNHETQMREVSPSIHRKKILIAEDTESNYMLVSYILKNEYDLVWARDGIEAIEMYKTEKPDLILMDVRMPRLSGITATTRIRETDKNIPIIALTAFAFDSDKQNTIDAGCTNFIAKPVNTKALKDMIQMYI